MNIQLRYIRYRDAPAYLGMDRNQFDVEVRPDMTEIPIGERGIGFDRLDLDAWADDYKNRNGRPSRKLKEVATCAQGPKAYNPPKMARKLSANSTRDGGYFPDLESPARMKPKLGSGKSKIGSTQKVKDLLNVCSRCGRTPPLRVPAKRRQVDRRYCLASQNDITVHRHATAPVDSLWNNG